MPGDLVQVKADIPIALKRKTFAILALKGQTFNSCIRHALEDFVRSNLALADYLRDVHVHEDEDIAVVK
jgi:hypothetical protein